MISADVARPPEPRTLRLSQLRELCVGSDFRRRLGDLGLLLLDLLLQEAVKLACRSTF
jgi:hypothetical protein